MTEELGVIGVRGGEGEQKPNAEGWALVALARASFTHEVVERLSLSAGWLTIPSSRRPPCS
jgi:hypothetical protein